MAFDMNNQDIMALIQQLMGSGANDLTFPPLQAMATPTPTPAPYNGIDMHSVQEGSINPELAAGSGIGFDPSTQPPQGPQPTRPNLGENFPDDFAGLGIGTTAPKVTQAQLNPAILAQLMQLAQSGMGGF